MKKSSRIVVAWLAVLPLAGLALLLASADSSPTSSHNQSGPAASSRAETPAVQPAQPFKPEQRVTVAGLTYVLHAMRWTTSLPTKEKGSQAGKMFHFLIVEFTVQNNDTRERHCNSLAVVDQIDVRHEADERSWLLGDSGTNTFGELKPSESRRHVHFYRLLDDIRYRLVIDGGYTASERVLIDAPPLTAK